MDKLNNMASMRKALESVNRFFRDCAIAHAGYEATSDIWSIVEKALSDPPRNCDVGTAKEQSRRCTDFCLRRLDRYPKHPCKTCPARTDDPKTKCEFIWAQLPYEATQEGDNP